jgi:hypothetical protein|tara:strand:- start:4 stop:711 length:708 start_codon:yes stop_codon:yes gene_type:complete
VKKRVRKLRGGGMDASKADFGDPGAMTSDAGFENTSPSKVSNVNTSGGSTKTKTTTTTSGSKDVPFKAPLPNVGVITGLINLGAYANYKGRQKFARKEGLYRDHYKTTGKTLQPNSPEGKAYVKEAGYGKPKTTTPDRDGPPTPTKITPPPVAAKPTPAMKPMMPYYMGFDFQNPKNKNQNNFKFKRGGLSGGKRFGPPPKKGPNAHGKCPFRPDGIRGVGAVQKGRGVKFVGVK